jgi:hypothetical protein
MIDVRRKMELAGFLMEWNTHTDKHPCIELYMTFWQFFNQRFFRILFPEGEEIIGMKTADDEWKLLMLLRDYYLSWT